MDVVKYQGSRRKVEVKVSEDTIVGSVDIFFWKHNKAVLSIDSNMMNIKMQVGRFILKCRGKVSCTSGYTWEGLTINEMAL